MSATSSWSRTVFSTVMVSPPATHTIASAPPDHILSSFLPVFRESLQRKLESGERANRRLVRAHDPSRHSQPHVISSSLSDLARTAVEPIVAPAQHAHVPTAYYPFAALRAQACSAGESSSKGLPQPAVGFNGAACEPRLARLMAPDGYPCLAHARAVGSPLRAVHLFPPVCPHCVRTLCPGPF